MKKILDGDYEKSYRKQLGEFSVDDREGIMFVINKNGKQRFISFYEDYLLPEDLKEAVHLIAEQFNLSIPMYDKANYSTQILLNFQDSLFKENPPPPPPLISTVEFANPVIDTE